MGNTMQQILTTLTTFPGNLVYHMIVAFSVAGALQAALNLWRDNEFPQGRRMVIGLGILLGMRFLMFIGAGLAQQGFSNPHEILPIFDRLTTILSILLIIWLWAFPEPMQLADATTSLLVLLSIVAATLSWAWWQGRSSDLIFTTTWLHTGWELYALAILLLGCGLLLIRRPNGWGYGIGMLVIATLGHLLQLSIRGTESNFSGFSRLAQMAAFPLLLSLPRRFNIALKSTTPEKAPVPETQPAPATEKQPRYGIKPERFQTILSMAAETDPGRLCKSITRAIANTMLSDICLLIYPPRRMGNLSSNVVTI